VCAAQLLRLLEVWLPAATTQRAAAAVVGILGSDRSLSGVGSDRSISGDMEPLLALPADDLRGLQVLWAVAEAIGPTGGGGGTDGGGPDGGGGAPAGAAVVEAALLALDTRGHRSAALHQAFALQCDLSAALDAPPYATTPFCGVCGHWRVLRSACLWCGEPHNLDVRLEQLAADAVAALPPKWLPPTANATARIAGPAGSAGGGADEAAGGSPAVVPAGGACAARRGAATLAAACLGCSDDAFRRNGGDMLFLWNNLATAATVLPQRSHAGNAVLLPADAAAADAAAEVEAGFVRVATRLIASLAQAPGLDPRADVVASAAEDGDGPADATADGPAAEPAPGAKAAARAHDSPARIARRAKTAAHAGIAASSSGGGDGSVGGGGVMSLHGLLNALEALHALRASGVHLKAAAAQQARWAGGLDGGLGGKAEGRGSGSYVRSSSGVGSGGGESSVSGGGSST
jgi:hypothetical protein